jgi:hypothetical protein
MYLSLSSIVNEQGEQRTFVDEVWVCVHLAMVANLCLHRSLADVVGVCECVTLPMAANLCLSRSWMGMAYRTVC